MNKVDNKVLYISGGGGLSEKSINIKTLSAIATSAFGIGVIKHVSYESNKKCSSATFLDEMGIKVCKEIAEVEYQFSKHNIAFVEAPKEDVLNNICPFLTMGENVYRFIGLNSIDNAMKYLFELKSKGITNAIIAVPSNNNFDEVSICSATQIFELSNGEIKNYIIHPENFGLKTEPEISMTGATPLYNKNLSLELLANKRIDAKLNVIVFNVGAILYLVGITPTIQKGIILAYEVFEKGLPIQKLIDITKR